MGPILLKYWKELAIVLLLAIVWWLKIDRPTQYVVENYYHEIVKKEIVQVETKVADKVSKARIKRVIVAEKPDGSKTTTTETEVKNEKEQQRSESTRVEKQETRTTQHVTVKQLLPKYHISGSYRPTDKSSSIGLEVRLGDSPVFIGAGVGYGGLVEKRFNYQLLIGVEL